MIQILMLCTYYNIQNNVSQLSPAGNKKDMKAGGFHVL